MRRRRQLCDVGSCVWRAACAASDRRGGWGGTKRGARPISSATGPRRRGGGGGAGRSGGRGGARASPGPSAAGAGGGGAGGGDRGQELLASARDGKAAFDRDMAGRDAWLAGALARLGETEREILRLAGGLMERVADEAK